MPEITCAENYPFGMMRRVEKNMKIVKRKPSYYIGIIVSIIGLLGLNFTEAALFQTISWIIIVLGLGLIFKGQVVVR